MRKITILMVFVALGMMAEGQISRYVKVTATGTGDGTSWANAAGNSSIQSMIDAVAGDINKGTVYFAAGTYTPTATITIKDGVNMMGGYSTDGNTRDLMLYQSILDGQDTRRVLTINGGDNALFTKSTVIDGFVIQRGKDNYGAAATIGFRILLRNCIIRNNRESGTGSGYGTIFMKATNASATFNGSIANCLIINNTTSRGVIFTSGDSKTFSIVNCIIANNKINTMDGATINKNFNSNGITFSNWTHSTQIINNIFWNNTGPSYSLPLRISNGTLGEVRNNIIEKQRDSISNNINASLTNYYSAPTFANSTSFVGHATNSPQTTELNNSDWRLKSGSQGINIGYSGQLKDRATISGTTEVLRNYTDYLSTDIMGNSRFISTTPEIGSYEYDAKTSTVSSSNNDHGTVNANQEVSKGSTITQTATPTSGYRFINWTESGTEVSTATSYTFTATANRTLQANFASNIVNINSAISSGATSLNNCADCEVTLNNGGELTVDASKTLKSVTVTSGGKLTLNAGTLSATNGIMLESDANGTATLLQSGNLTGTVTAKQYLGSARNWYVSSPVSSASAPATVMDYYYEYMEGGNNTEFATQPGSSSLYWKGLANGTTMETGKGYIAKTNAGVTVQFSGTPNNGNITTAFDLTRNDAKGKGFNLVGNPYPSYIDWSDVAAANPNLENTYYYRTKNTNVSTNTYTFVTWNGAGAGSFVVSNGSLPANTSITRFIPPAQAFWVRVKSGTSATKMYFNNGMREHRDDDYNLMKAPKASTRASLRLQLQNGADSDEMLVYLDEDASNNYDAYDSPKMMNNSVSVPDLYSRVGDERLVINGLNSITDNMELPLGFSLNAAATLELKATEMSNFPKDTRVYLRDKQENKETELTPETDYTFSTTEASANNETRFRLLFRAPGVSTDVTTSERDQVSVFVNTQNEIVILAKENSNYAIYNAVGQLIKNGKIINNLPLTINHLNGVFVVKVNNQSAKVVIK